MTPEEINRTIEFILQHEVQTSVRLEALSKNQARHEELFAQMAVQGQRMSDLIEIQSRRMDHAEKRHEELMREIPNVLSTAYSIGFHN